MKYDKEYKIIENKLNELFTPHVINLVRIYNIKTGMNIIKLSIDDFYSSFVGMDEMIVSNLIDSGVIDNFIEYMIEEMSNFIKDELSNRNNGYIPTCFL